MLMMLQTFWLRTSKINQTDLNKTYKKKRWGYTILLDFAENLESKTARIANQHESEY